MVLTFNDKSQIEIQPYAAYKPHSQVRLVIRKEGQKGVIVDLDKDEAPVLIEAIKQTLAKIK